MDKRVRFLRKKSRSGAQEVIMSDEKTLVGAVKTEQGVEVKGMLMQPVVEKCEGCDRVRTFEEQQFFGKGVLPRQGEASSSPFLIFRSRTRGTYDTFFSAY